MDNNLKAFVQAVHKGNLQLVRSLAATHPGLIHAHDPHCFGATPLIRAVQAGDRAMVDLLLDLGADINQRSQWWAGSFGILDDCSDEMADYLLTRGATLTPHAAARLGKITDLRAMITADPSTVHARGGDGQFPLHFARTIEIADLLLHNGAQLDGLDIDHASTPAQWLSASRQNVAAHLVTRGAAADPFMAARIGDCALLERLIKAEPEGVQVRVSRARFPAPPPAAGHIYLYTIGEGCSLVHAAAESEQRDAILWLTAHGADVNARGGYDDATAFHAAAWGNRPVAINALLDAGADINAVSGPMHRNQPIGWAIVSGAVAAFRTLLERGATVRQAHRDDARRGAEGAFQEFQSRRPLAAWQEILGLLPA